MDFSKYYEYEDGNLINKITKHIYCNLDRDGYVRVRKDGKEYRAHRIIWSLFNGDIPEGMLIDHKDGDVSNNNISNLRLATRQQNNANSRKRHFNECPKGVTKVGKRYRARISYNNTTISLGTFDTPEEASEVYNNKAIELNGEFANVN